MLVSSSLVKRILSKKRSSLGEGGISLLMTLMILGTLMIVSTTVASVVFRVGSFSKSIGTSEIAFLTAEAAVERALYQFESGGVSLAGLAETGNLTGISGAGWITSAWASSTPPLNNSALSAINPNDPVDAANPLTITLAPGQIFEIDLSLSGVNYPVNFMVGWPGGATQAGKVIWYSLAGQASTTQSSNASVPPTSSGFQLNPDQKWQTKVINRNPGGGSNISFTLTPAPGSSLPMRAVISATGTYQDQEREIQVQRPMWLVY